MANNTVFDKDQIPVPVQDRTYYGCCAMCTKMLQTGPKNRTAVNPCEERRMYTRGQRRDDAHFSIEFPPGWHREKLHRNRPIMRRECDSFGHLSGQCSRNIQTAEQPGC